MPRFLATLIALLLLPLSGHAADLYVNGATGNDVNSCNHADQPCKTIKAALDKAPVGHHTIRVTRGVYTEEKMTIPGHRFITIKGGYDETFSPRICGAKPGTIIQTGRPGANYYQHWLTIAIQGQGNEASLGLDCLELHSTPGSLGRLSCGIFINPQSEAKAWFSMRHVRATGFEKTILYMTSSDDATLSIHINNSLFTNNDVELGSPLIEAVSFSGELKATLESVAILDNKRENNGHGVNPALRIDNNGDGKMIFSMKNCMVANQMVNRELAISAYSTPNTSTTRIMLTNTTLVQNGNAISAFASDHSTISIHGTNNILMHGNGPAEDALYLSTYDKATIDFSSSYSMMGQAETMGPGSTVTSTNAVHGDPLLDSRYHLKKGSPAIDAGICGGYVPTPTFHYERIAPYDDIDGDKRPGVGKIFGCDIGADEYKAFPWPMFLPAIIHQHHSPYSIPTTPHF